MFISECFDLTLQIGSLFLSIHLVSYKLLSCAQVIPSVALKLSSSMSPLSFKAVIKPYFLRGHSRLFPCELIFFLLLSLQLYY